MLIKVIIIILSWDMWHYQRELVFALVFILSYKETIVWCLKTTAIIKFTQILCKFVCQAQY